MADVDDTIDRAIREGKFDNLSGKGKPLNLDDESNTDPEWRLAYRVLKNAGYSPPWIEQRKEIESEIEATRGALRRAWEWHHSGQNAEPAPGQADPEWVRAQHRFADAAERINRRIRDYNLETPSTQFQLQFLKLERELEQMPRSAPTSQDSSESAGTST